mgnify:FL=1
MLKALETKYADDEIEVSFKKGVSRFTTILFPQNNIMESEYA